MAKLFPLFITWTIVSAATMTYAQKSRPDFSQFESRLLSIQNPFESQLPKKEGVAIKAAPNKPASKPKPVSKPPKSKKPSPPKIPSPPIREIPLPNIVISGIIWDADHPQAIINGKVVGIGDTVSEVTITNIQKSGINGLFHNKPVTLKP